MLGSDFKITVKTKELVRILEDNLKEHKKIVKEAKTGYLRKAKKVLQERLVDIQNGKIVALHFNTPLPEDHSEQYERAIRMLGLHLKDSVEVSAEDYKRYVENEWSWMRGFLSKNAHYSATAAEMQDDDFFDF